MTRPEGYQRYISVVQSQLDAMVPQLRSEIEKVMRRLVTDALARELRANPGSTLA